MIEYIALIIFLSGLSCILLPSKFRKLIHTIAFLTTLFSLIHTVYVFINKNNTIPLELFKYTSTGFFKYTSFSGLIAMFCCFFSFITVYFSMQYIKNKNIDINKYYGYILWALSFSFLTVYSSNLLVMTIFWGLSGLILYLLANLCPEAASTAKKSFVIIGGSDSLMIFGISILFIFTGSFDIYNIHIQLGQGHILPEIAFICLVITALTKAGAMPFHTWIPVFAETMPLSISAFLPASLDKLLGIFLLILISKQLFIMSSLMTLALMSIGALTVICAVYMAVIQHDFRKLLSYHAVSQVGYMILGIATGSAIGIAGGIFHMLNNAIYKSALFFTGGAVEQKTNTTEIDMLGGLSKYMPVTFTAAVIASLAISGIPPLNGFASKWMIYQSLIERSLENPKGLIGISCYLFLIIAMFGSALTLASFIKFIHSIYLGQNRRENFELPDKKQYNEVSKSMLIPMTILALLCIILGVFPYSISLKYFIKPALSSFNIYIYDFAGIWNAGITSILVFIGIVLGIIFYIFYKANIRKNSIFIGGENLPFEARVRGGDFYKTILEIKIFKHIYNLAENKLFDMYALSLYVINFSGRILSKMHTGSLHTYLLIFIFGCIFLLFVLLK